tara:strand:+ start:495 stop:725 length:231 start_codon:yes stop_codon:yes gene_type:complete
MSKTSTVYRFIQCWADEQPADGFPGHGYYQAGQNPTDALQRLEKRRPAGVATRYFLDTRAIQWTDHPSPSAPIQRG